MSVEIRLLVRLFHFSTFWKF